MNISDSCCETLLNLKDLIESIDEESFKKPQEILSEATIGQHVRHIIEFFQVLCTGWQEGVISYDNRERCPHIETSPEHAMKAIEQVITQIQIMEDQEKTLLLKCSFETGGHEDLLSIPTTLIRELAYNLEHAIHHMAIIKIGVKSLNGGHIVPENFGMAPSTIKYRQKTCAQ